MNIYLMDIKKFNDYSINEASLNWVQFDKSNYGQVLVDKIQNGEPLKLNNSDKTIIINPNILDEIADIDTTDSNQTRYIYNHIKAKNGRKKFIDDDQGISVPLSGLERTEDFKRPKAEPREKTLSNRSESILYEYIQCAFLEYYQVYKISLDHQKFDLDEFIQFYENTWYNIPENNIYREKSGLSPERVGVLLSDKSWLKSQLKTVDFLYNKSISDKDENNKTFKRTVLNKGVDYKFVHTNSKDPVITLLYFKFWLCRNSINWENEMGGKVDVNKFTPADIWAYDISKTNEIVNLINDSMFETDLKNKKIISQNSPDELFERLTTIVSDLFINGLLIGISLKKCSDKSNIILNSISKIPKIYLESIRISSTNTGVTFIFNSKRWWANSKKEDKIHDEIMELEIRSSGMKQGTTAELGIKGSVSKSGKFSLKHLNDLLNKHGIKDRIPTESWKTAGCGIKFLTREIDKYANIVLPNFRYSSNSHVDTDILKQSIRNSYNKYRKNGSGDENEYGEYELSKFYALYQGCKFASILAAEDGKSGNEDIINVIFREFINSALSIENKYFKSPIYARFI